MVISGTASEAALPKRYRRVPTWLVWVVLLAHVLGLEWVARHTTGQGLLQNMAEPEFNQSLALQGQLPGHDDPVKPAPTLPPAPSTVGQVVLARTVVSPTASQSVEQQPRTAARPVTRTQPTSQAPASRPADLDHAPVPASTIGDAHTTDAVDEPTREPAAPSTVPSPAPVASDVPVLPSAQSSSAPAAVPAQAPSSQTTDDPALWLTSWPRSTRLNYQLKGYFRGDFYGTARVQWQRSAQRYQAQINVSVGLLLDMRMTSQGRITAARLWPEAYEEERRGKKRGVRFGDQVVTLDNGNTLNRPPQLQDTASQFVQLAQDFATKRLSLQVGTVVPVTLGRPGGVDDWVYDVVAVETLPTPMGDLAAYHLKPRPLPNARGTVSAEIWFAPALQHLPVRIRLSLNPETWLDLTLDGVAQSD